MKPDLPDHTPQQEEPIKEDPIDEESVERDKRI